MTDSKKETNSEGITTCYKYRSPKEIEFALDIILNKRLYCADWKEMNDHREGEFWLREEQIEKMKGIVDKKCEYKICSLAQDWDIYLLWAHYADDFRGLAIELELSNNNLHDIEIKKVNYEKERYFLPDNGYDEGKIVKEILLRKYKPWEYEKEVRILCKAGILKEGKYYDVKVKKVIAGHRMKEAPQKCLKLICKQEGIPLYKTQIDNNGVTTTPLGNSN